MSGASPPPYPIVAFVSVRTSFAPSGAGGNRSVTRFASPGPAPSALSSKSPSSRISSKRAFTPSSCFARDRAAAAVDALALFFATNCASFAAFAFSFVAAA
jgi:hypothetical protein